MSGAPSSMTHRRRQRLVYEAYSEQSGPALAELREWATAHHREAERLAARDGQLRLLLQQFAGER
jgi:hypothetical protein